MSSGEIVDISNSNISLDSMHEEITDTIEYVRDFSDQMQDVLTQAIEDLKATVGAYSPNLIEIDTDLAAMDRPVFPDAPTFEAYSSVIRDDLIAWVRDGLENGGTGLTAAVYATIVEREKNARRTNQDESYRQALDGVGSRGFNLPSGQVGSLQAKIQSEIIKADQDSLNNITEKDFDLAQNNSQFIVTAGTMLEQTLTDTWAKIQDTTVAVYNATIQGIVGQYNALSKWVSAEIERIKVEADIAIKNEELGLSAYNAMTLLAEKVAESIAQIASQSIASALGAINTSLSNSYSGSEGRTEAWRHGESLGETHSYSG